jgi:hypothetical protein
VTLNVKKEIEQDYNPNIAADFIKSSGRNAVELPCFADNDQARTVT